MGQNDVLQFLKENYPKWFTAEEIRKSVGIGASTIFINMYRLRKDDSVLFRERQNRIVGRRPALEYKYKK